MNDELRQYYDNLQEMFNMEGWKQYTSYVKGISDNHEQAWGDLKFDAYKLVYNSGIVYNCKSLLNFEASHVNAYADILQQEEEVEEDE